MSYQLINSLITVFIMTFGLLANLIVLLTIRKMVSMKSSFGIITKNQAVCNILMCLLFLIFVGPLQLTSVGLCVRSKPENHIDGNISISKFIITK
ncbi:Protein CBR-SRX-20 [Caenorhabditis briggsae]|uniref:Protein CBR-SRX-20 n=1 Tax=Caenorhabditis briggsae TaxID=6238 RepID=A8X1U1_CAEBR|nr:Protein CBR-SRX-20 [Caenorhabditis briggsae]CAP26601.2 Protein CBR-SRX-20 [Caenorhabditis briggsae]